MAYSTDFKQGALYSGLNLEQYTKDSKTFLEINLTFLISLFISYFNLLYQIKEGHRHGESFAESVIREIYEETGLTIQNPQLVGIKNWPLDTGGRYIVICYKATEFSGTLRSSDEGEVSWVQKDQIPNLDLAYDMLPLMEMMEAPDKSEFFYPRRTEDDWEKKIFQSFTK